MNQTERDVIEILKESMTGKPAGLSAEPDWQAIYTELRNQALAPFGYEIYKKRRSTDFDPLLDAEWSRTVLAHVNKWYVMMDSQQELVDLLSSAGYDFAIMKGIASAALYPVPEFRKSGDIDFLVRWDDYEEVCGFLVRNGFTMVELQEAAEYHTVLTKDGVKYEMHKRPGGTKTGDNPEAEAQKAFFQAGLDHVEYVEIERYSFPVLPALQNGMVLLCHLAGHMREGVGLRHLLDWMVYAEKYLSDDYWEESFREEACKVRLSELAKVMTKTCQKCFGLNKNLTWCRDADLMTCKHFLEYLVTQGDFGTKASGCDRGTRLLTESQGITGFLKRLDTSSLYSMPAARKYRVLRPVAWGYQILRYLYFGLTRDKPLKKIYEDKKKSDERSNLFADLHI